MADIPTAGSLLSLLSKWEWGCLHIKGTNPAQLCLGKRNPHVTFQKRPRSAAGMARVQAHGLTCRMSGLTPTVMLRCCPGCGAWLASPGPGSDSSRSCWMTSVTAWALCWLGVGATWASVCCRGKVWKSVAYKNEAHVKDGARPRMAVT